MVPLPSLMRIYSEEGGKKIPLMILAKAACTNNRKSPPSKSRLRLLRFQVSYGASKENFDVNPIVHTKPPLFPYLTAETIKELWYHKEEIAETKRVVGNILRHRQSGGAKKPKGDDEFRGLERLCMERHCAKKAAIKLVLLAQNFKFANAEYLRSVSEKCSAKARAIAQQQGYIDFLQIQESEEEESTSRSLACRKRKDVSTDDDEAEPTTRRVRKNTL